MKDNHFFQTSAGSNPCESAFNIVQCFQKADPEVNILFDNLVQENKKINRVTLFNLFTEILRNLKTRNFVGRDDCLDLGRLLTSSIIFKKKIQRFVMICNKQFDKFK